MKKRTDLKRKRAGFTLVELMIVIVIMVILAAAAVPVFRGYVERARLAKYYEQIYTVRTAAETALQELSVGRDLSDTLIIYKIGVPNSDGLNKKFAECMETYLDEDIRKRSVITAYGGEVWILLYLEPQTNPSSPTGPHLEFNPENGDIRYVEGR